MNRDALLATVIGFGVGLLITGILLLGPNLRGILPTITWPNWFGGSKTQNEQPTTPSIALTIDSPLADAIELSDEVLVSGAATPGSTVVLVGPIDEVVTTATTEGKYAGKLTLTEGTNEIVVTMYIAGTPTAQRVTVYYTPEEF